MCSPEGRFQLQPSMDTLSLQGHCATRCPCECTDESPIGKDDMPWMMRTVLTESGKETLSPQKIWSEICSAWERLADPTSFSRAAYARGNLVFHLCQDSQMKTIWQRRARFRSPLPPARRSQRARCAACGSTGTRASLPDVWLLSINWVHHWHAQRFARRACAAQSRPRVACAARLHSKRANLRGPPLD
jgi:hypothetical protein